MFLYEIYFYVESDDRLFKKHENMIVFAFISTRNLFFKQLYFILNKIWLTNTPQICIVPVSVFQVKKKLCIVQCIKLKSPNSFELVFGQATIVGKKQVHILNMQSHNIANVNKL